MLKLGFIGCGQFGGRLANEFALFDYEAIAINTTEKDMATLDYIAPQNRKTITLPSSKGGAGKDPSIGEEAAIYHGEMLCDFIKEKMAGCDRVFVCGGLGGGTGTGSINILAKILLHLEIPVGLIFTIPAKQEDAIVKTNAIGGLKGITTLANEYTLPIFLFDNERLQRFSQKKNINLSECNKIFAAALHSFNIRANNKSHYRTFDEADYQRLFEVGGLMAVANIHMPSEDCFESVEYPIKQMMMELKDHPFAPVEPQEAMQAGIIIETKKKLPSEKMNHLELAIDFAQTAILPGGSGNVFAGLYASKADIEEEETSETSIRMSVILAGAPLPRERINELHEEAQSGQAMLEQKQNKTMDSLNLEDLGGLKNVLGKTKRPPLKLSFAPAPGEPTKNKKLSFGDKLFNR